MLVSHNVVLRSRYCIPCRLETMYKSIVKMASRFKFDYIVRTASK
jgi:hypothetical protein